MLIPYGLDDARIGRIPRACLWIAGVCLLVQVVASATGVNEPWGLALHSQRGLFQTGTLTASFAHGGWWHLVGNLFVFLLVCGPFLEDAWGSAWFLLVYFASSFSADVATLIVHADHPVRSMGASGAIAGCLAAFAVRFGKRRIRILSTWTLPILPTLLVPAWLWIGFGFAVDAWALVHSSGGRVAVEAHVAGGIAGALLALLAKRLRIEDRLLRAEGGWRLSPPLHRAERAAARGDVAGARVQYAKALAEEPLDPVANLGLARLEIAARRFRAALPCLERIGGSPLVSPSALAEALTALGPERLGPGAALLFAERLEEHDRALCLALAERAARAGGRTGARASILAARLALRGRDYRGAQARAAAGLAAPDLAEDLRGTLAGLEREAARHFELALET